MPLPLNSKKETDALESLREIRNMLEKRSRNLEKKKNKLDVYKDKSDKGEKLNEDQTKAVERLDGVSKQIEIVVELQTYVTTALDACEKSGKKKEKRDRYEKEKQDVNSFARLTEIQTMLQEIDEIREYLTTGERGTVCLTEVELELLDDLYKTLNPSRSVGETGVTYSERLKQTGDFIVNLLEGRDRPSNMAALSQKETETSESNSASTTYKELKDLVDKVLGCEYFTGQKVIIENEPVEEVGEVHEETTDVVETPCESVENRATTLLNGDSGLAADESVPATEQFAESSESEEPTTNGTDVDDEHAPSASQSRPIASWSEVAAADGDKKNNSGLSDMIDHLQSNYTFLVESRLDSTTPTNPSPPQQVFVEQPVQHQVAAPKQSNATSAPIPVPAKKSTWADDSDVNASGSWADEPLIFDAHSPANAPVSGPTESRGHIPEVDIFASASQSDYLQSGGDEGEDGGGSWQQQHPRSSGHRGTGGRGGFRRDRERGSGGSRGFRGSRGGGYRGRGGGNWNNDRGGSGNERTWNSRGGGHSERGGYRGGSGGGGNGPYRGGGNYRGYRANFDYQTASSGSNY